MRRQAPPKSPHPQVHGGFRAAGAAVTAVGTSGNTAEITLGNRRHYGVLSASALIRLSLSDS
ncbi:hypothetical protein GCM10023214_11000 [Amycolatopsis dongchuanensis]|uniref:Uncharacterized protein n=1 Tax=Amycolatopsis dongchuanensis TaxID=1070866 RepID=A0ABP9Q0Z8_9PSEU